MRRPHAAGVLGALGVVAALWAPASRAAERAPALVSFKRAACLYTACFLEPLIPDARYELGGESGPGWVLSWPIHPWASRPLDVPGPTLVASPFLEPQLRLGPSRLRVLAGARLSLFPDTARWGALVEGAGLWGSDGRGGVVGAGLTYDFVERHRETRPWTLSLVWRRSWVDTGARHDFSLDVTVPLNMFLGSPLREGEERPPPNGSGNPDSAAGPSSSVFPARPAHTM